MTTAGATAAEVLARAAAVGPFFGVRTDTDDPRDNGFLPLTEVYAAPAALGERMEYVAGRLGTAERRVAASLVHQGLAGRLWSLALAPAVLFGRVPDLAADGLWWHPLQSAPAELLLPEPVLLPPVPVGMQAAGMSSAGLPSSASAASESTVSAAPVGDGHGMAGPGGEAIGDGGRLPDSTDGMVGDGGRLPDSTDGVLAARRENGPQDSTDGVLVALAGQVRAAVVGEHLEPLAEATRALTPVAAGLLWGNAASALVGTLRVLHGWCLGAGRTDAAERAVALVARLLDDPLLRDGGPLDPRGPSFRRRSCCLYYRVPGGGLCGDCSLRSVPSRGAS